MIGTCLEADSEWYTVYTHYLKITFEKWRIVKKKEKIFFSFFLV